MTREVMVCNYMMEQGIKYLYQGCTRIPQQGLNWHIGPISMLSMDVAFAGSRVNNRMVY